MMPQKAVPQAPALRLPSWKLGRLIVSWNESGQSCTHTPTQSLLVLRNSPSISPAAQGNTLTVILGACHLPHIHSTVSSTILSLHTLQMSLHPRPTTSLPHSEFCSLLIDLPASTFVPTSLLGQPEEFLKKCKSQLVIPPETMASQKQNLSYEPCLIRLSPLLFYIVLEVPARTQTRKTKA